MTRSTPQLIEIDLTEEQWAELVAMSFDPFEFESFEPMTYGQWEALGEMALGKAVRIRGGEYEILPGETRKSRAAILDEIAWLIFAGLVGHTRPGAATNAHPRAGGPHHQ